MASIFHIPYISNIARSRQLAAQAFADERVSYRKKQERKSLLYAMLHPGFAARWFRLLDSPEFTDIYQSSPRIYMKPFRVYMSIKWTREHKVKVLVDTYRFIRQNAPSLMTAVTGGHLEIVRIKLSEEMTGVLMLSYDYKYRKEGELVITFECEQLGGTIASAAFSFEELQPDSWICRIGCIQGHQKQDSYPSKEAQKLLHGLRPKSLVLFALQELCRDWNLKAIYGAGDFIQAYRRKHAIHIQTLHSIRFDYNAFWEESGGKPLADGWFDLPLSMVRKEIKDVKTSKRALYTRRYKLLDGLATDIEQAAQVLLH